MHDALQLEQLGVPATIVITDVFQGILAAFAENLGAPGYPAVVVPHPLSARPVDFLQARAREAADVALRHLVPGDA